MHAAVAAALASVKTPSFDASSPSLAALAMEISLVEAPAPAAAPPVPSRPESTSRRPASRASRPAAETRDAKPATPSLGPSAERFADPEQGQWLSIRAPRRAGSDVPALRPESLVPMLAPLAAEGTPTRPDLLSDSGAGHASGRAGHGRDGDVTSDWVPDGHGGFAVERTGFVAAIDRDGHVHIHDRPSIEAEIALPCVPCLGHSLAETLVDWSRDPYAYTRGLDRRQEGAENQALTPGRPMLRSFGREPAGGPSKPEDKGVYVPLITGQFDVTDAVMRAHGEDPYRHAKQKFIEETADVREGMASIDGSRVRQESLSALPRRLVALWQRADLPAVERRRVLFLLWDECAEEGEPAVVHAAARARAAIVSFVRLNLPRGHADAYDDSELEALNRGRSSRMPFQPYVDGGDSIADE